MANRYFITQKAMKVKANPFEAMKKYQQNKNLAKKIDMKQPVASRNNLIR